MKQQLIRLLSITAPILLFSSFCSSARADMGAIYAQSSIDMMTTTVTNYNNKMGVDEYVKRNGGSNRTSTRTSKNQRPNGSKLATGTTFSSDPNISRQIQNNFISKMDDPRGKKFLTFLLTPNNAKKIFRSFHPEEQLNFNDMVDVFTIASLYSFMTIEDKQNVSKEQIRSTRQRFRELFAGRSIDSATLQRSSESLLYLTMLIAFSQLKAQESNTNVTGMAKIKVNASELMTGIGLNPAKYTLSSRGFVLK
jgi:hypothetical protein